MAAINRAPWTALVDDDGSNLTGSIWNKAAIKDVLLDPIDVAIAPTYGTFTPADFSGAGLVFPTAVGTFARHGRLVFLWMHVVYPATSNAAQATIGGFPAIVAAPGAGGVHGYGKFLFWYIPDGTAYMIPIEPLSGSFQTNANMSGANVIVSATYLTP